LAIGDLLLAGGVSTFPGGNQINRIGVVEHRTRRTLYLYRLRGLRVALVYDSPWLRNPYFDEQVEYIQRWHARHHTMPPAEPGPNSMSLGWFAIVASSAFGAMVIGAILFPGDGSWVDVVGSLALGLALGLGLWWRFGRPVTTRRSAHQ
jgi:hypothetical protein